MFRRHSEMYIHFAGIVLRIHRTFGQMLFHSRAGCLRIRMKKQQTFRELSIVQSFWLQQVGDNSFILSKSNQRRNIFRFILNASLIQGIIESKFPDVVEKLLLKRILRLVIVGRQELIQVFEHTACRTRSRHELHDLLILCQVSIPSIHISSLFFLRDHHNPFLNRGRSCNFQKRKPFHETS